MTLGSMPIARTCGDGAHTDLLAPRRRAAAERARSTWHGRRSPTRMRLGPSIDSIGVRWTIGDVSPAGFEALRLSILGARRCFGARGRYAVCVNSIPLDEARARLGAVGEDVALVAVTRAQIPPFLARRLDDGLSQGTSWKFAPLRVHEGVHELALDNDCILWRVPDAIARWLDDPDPRATLLAEDTRACYGAFASLCGEAPRNAGIRGLGPAFDLEAALRVALDACPGRLETELDEQGMQVAALSGVGVGAGVGAPHHVVALDDVTICSPVPPHRRDLGRAGAHFVGVNARAPWCEIDGRPITELVQAHWRRHRGEVERLVAE